MKQLHEIIGQDVETDNAETTGILPILENFLNEVYIPFEEHFKRTDELEFKKRSGFIPHRWNRGGMDLTALS